MKKNIRSQIPPLLFWTLGILALSVMIGHPLFDGQMPETHDSFLNLIRIACIKKAWLEGQIFPRWAPDMIWGYGYPILNFYQPFFQHFASLLSFITKNIVIAQNTASFLVYFGSGLSMFIFTSSLWSRPAGFLAASAYLFFPYHITDLYIRGAYAELTAFAIIPIILWAVKRLHDTLKTRYMLALSIGISLLSLSHNITNALFTPWLLLFALLLLILKEHGKIEFAIKTTAAFFFGIGIASFYLLPAIIEKSHVQLDRMSKAHLDYTNNFLDPNQLTQWIWTYQGPGNGPYQNIIFELGIIHVFLLFIAIILAIKHWKEAATPRMLLVFFAAMALSSIYMSTKWSLPAWESLPALKFIQFPWRFLVLTALAFSVLIGFCASRLKKYPAIIFISISVLLLTVVNMPYCRPITTRSLPLTNDTLNIRTIPPGEGGEFMPKTFKRLLWPRSPNPADIWKGEGIIQNHRATTSIKHVFSIDARSELLVCFNSFYFPGWTVQTQGRAIPILDDNPFGLIFFALPAGEHTVDIFFQDTPIRKWAAWLSWVSLTGLLAFTFLSKMMPGTGGVKPSRQKEISSG